MRFDDPAYLALLALVPAALALYRYAARRRRQALAAFAGGAPPERLLARTSARRRLLKSLSLVGAATALVLALGQPQWGTSLQDLPHHGRDIVVVLDVSLSMLAEDGTGSRLERATEGLRALAAELGREGGNRLSLVLFAGRANLHCPLTHDTKYFLERVDKVSVDASQSQGTSIGNALRQALAGFGELDHEHTDLILVSDGEDHQSLPLEAARVAAAHGVAVHTVAVGDSVDGTPLFVTDESGRPVPLEHGGEQVRSRTQPALLREVSRLTGGAFLDAGSGAVDLVRIYRDRIDDKPTRRLDASTGESLVPRFQLFVALAIALLALELLVSDTRAPRPRSAP